MNYVSQLFSAISFAVESYSKNLERRQAEIYQDRMDVLELMEVDHYRLFPLSELIDGRRETRYVLNFVAGQITGPEAYAFEQIQEVQHFYQMKNGTADYYVSLKIVDGPYLCTEPGASESAAEARAQSIARRAGAPYTRRLFNPETAAGPTLKALEQDYISGQMELLSSVETADGLLVPVTLNLIALAPSSARGELLFGDEIKLHDGQGHWATVAKPDEITAHEVSEEYEVYESSEVERLVLHIKLRRGFAILLSESAGSLHDDPIPGEADELAANMKAMKLAAERIRIRLGLGPSK